MGSIPSRDCTNLQCASGAQGELLSKRSEVMAHQLDLQSLMPLSIAGCGSYRWATSVPLVQIVYN